MKVRHMPAAFRHDPAFVLRHGRQMLAHTFRGSTWRSLVGLESPREAFRRYRTLRKREREYVDWPDPLGDQDAGRMLLDSSDDTGRPALSHAVNPPASSLTFVKPAR